MRVPEKIVFKESRRIEVEGFPDHVIMSPGFLNNNPVVKIDDNGLVSVIADNGWAKYKLDPVQDSDDGICLVRVASGAA